MKNENPFLINQYLRPKHFIGRKDETSYIIENLNSSKNIQLIGKCGIGKTSLIKNVLYHLNKYDEIKTIYLDLLKIQSIHQFLNELIKRNLNIISEKKGKKLKKEIYTGHPKTVNPFVNLSNEELNIKLVALFDNYFGIGKTVIALDNFQNVNNDLLKDFEEIILTTFLKRDNIHLILSGTKRIVNSDLFKIIELQKISAEDLRKYLLKQFDVLKIEISEKAITRIIGYCKGDMSLFQSLCSKLVDENSKNIKSKKVEEIFEQIINESYHHLESLKPLLSPYQWKLLCAIGKEGEAVQVTSGNFINQYQLNAPSSVKTALDALQEKELIFRIENYYSVANPLLEYWLKKA